MGEYWERFKETLKKKVVEKAVVLLFAALAGFSIYIGPLLYHRIAPKLNVIDQADLESVLRHEFKRRRSNIFKYSDTFNSEDGFHYLALAFALTTNNTDSDRTDIIDFDNPLIDDDFAFYARDILFISGDPPLVTMVKTKGGSVIWSKDLITHSTLLRNYEHLSIETMGFTQVIPGGKEELVISMEIAHGKYEGIVVNAYDLNGEELASCEVKGVSYIEEDGTRTINTVSGGIAKPDQEDLIADWYVRNCGPLIEEAIREEYQ